MARGILGKSRPSPEAQSISKPVLKYTDALPRNDLREIEGGISYSRPIHQVVKAEQHPGTSAGRSPKRKTGAPTPGFDFQITVPPAEASFAPSETDHALDESMIGIALGSPRLLESQLSTTQGQRNPPPTPPDVESPPSALQRKSSKWRKIGGLFKAKSAVAPNVNKPFYQVRAETERPSQGSSHSIDYKSRQRAGSKTEPIENTELWPCLVSEQEAIMQKQSSSSTNAQGSLLQVEIPKVELERYSVMFGGLLNNSRPSLLNRRSKTLDDVTIPGQEVCESTQLTILLRSQHTGILAVRATAPPGDFSNTFKVTKLYTLPNNSIKQGLKDPRNAKSASATRSLAQSPAGGRRTITRNRSQPKHAKFRDRTKSAAISSSTALYIILPFFDFHRVR
ncbi:hypothetical protein ASPCAL03389 [Aspergillus calidoustus]|uniref:Uncharacterized protein n=1 Tax=Aspergillus calidoustus TaxID=454130 RepID=A0A0U5C3Z1_ASPCI|nr:hypothetical protein ASPCAL03389 [Aspergillus calidoustus]